MRASLVVVAIVVAACRGTPPAEEAAAEPAVAAAVETPPPAEPDAPAPSVPPVAEPAPPPAQAPAAEPAPAPQPPAAAPPAAPCVFEKSQPWPRPEPGTLATMSYPPTDKEKPFHDRLYKEGWPGMAAVMSMPREVDKSVAWFGVVRGIRADAARGETRLLLENKYFDGLTDTHILCLSFAGGGDFVAVLAGSDHPVKPLAVVRVYGKVVAVKDDVPRVKAEYVRQFDQGTYCFMMVAGKPQGNQSWRELCRVADDDMYSPFPNASYYVDRLGPRDEFAPGKVPVPED